MTARDVRTVVRPLRFTDDVAAMRAFLELLGLSPRVESRFGGWVDMVAGAGMVAFHAAASSATGGSAGETRLSFESSDLDGLAAELEAAGFGDTAMWDESYGRVLCVTGPDGLDYWVDGYNGDDYGFVVHEPRRAEGLSVLALKPADHSPRMAAFLGAFGLGSLGDARFGGHPGLVELVGEGPTMVGGRLGIQLAVETAEPIAQVLDRLHRHGSIDTRVEGAVLAVTDPDGSPFVIRGTDG